ncbi:uncharacterized protein E5676_scaffold299G001810 [Cucumis melo var. makuwa]|uniref:Uncharacterized protein n=1 Tax=Cucumis melo var. makuwa TaxID=1194695 RepID=A0A5D3CP32_CUCMM|nr:uncharacterized protein E5676_scaffold299G001810 [Cucumis melo var. makuwa]
MSRDKNSEFGNETLKLLNDDGNIDVTSKGQSIENIFEGGGATMKRIKIDRKTITVKEDENSNDRSKIKNVGSDPDSCLFGADRYLQIHKSTASKKKLLNSKKN